MANVGYAGETGGKPQLAQHIFIISQRPVIGAEGDRNARAQQWPQPGDTMAQAQIGAGGGDGANPARRQKLNLGRRKPDPLNQRQIGAQQPQPIQPRQHPLGVHALANGPIHLAFIQNHMKADAARFGVGGDFAQEGVGNILRAGQGVAERQGGFRPKLRVEPPHQRNRILGGPGIGGQRGFGQQGAEFGR